YPFIDTFHPFIDIFYSFINTFFPLNRPLPTTSRPFTLIPKTCHKSPHAIPSLIEKLNDSGPVRRKF
ncbi:MAG: hypothetical protein ACRCWQ_06295, partial [Bacilli bacterium]